MGGLVWLHTRDEVCLGRDDTSPPPWWEEAGEHSPDSVQLQCLIRSPPTPRLLVTWYGTMCPNSSLVLSASSGGNKRPREMTLEALEVLVR